jgi:hypothetical protein
MSGRDHGFSKVMLIVLLLLFLAMPAKVVWAHGGGVPRLTNAEAGPYWVSVWTQPDPLQVGQAHVTVAVSQPSESTGGRQEAGPPVLNARVQVQFSPLDHVGESLLVLATHEGAANKLFYEADLEFPETGQWQATVEVAGPEGSGKVGFEAQVYPQKSANWLWLGGVGVLALGALWVVQRRRGGNGQG